MAIGTCFEHTKTSINQWIENYNQGLCHSKDLESVKQAGWICWENIENLPVEVKKINDALKIIAESGKFDNDNFFVRLKEVPVFGRETRTYANVIISQELNNLPVIIFTPDQNGVSELFLISNKHKVTGTMEDIKVYLNNQFSL